MSSTTALTLYAFGNTAFYAGLSTLFDPQSNAQFLALPAAALTAVRGNGLAAIAIGNYYTLAAYQENTVFALASVPMLRASSLPLEVIGASRPGGRAEER